MKPTAKDALSLVRSMVTGKMFALAGIPLLLLAVAMGALSLFRFSLLDQTLESRAEHMYSLARSVFQEAEIEPVALADDLIGFCALNDEHTAGGFAAVYDNRGYAAVAWGSSGELLLEQSDLPEGPARDKALNAARIAAIELAALKRGDVQ